MRSGRPATVRGALVAAAVLGLLARAPALSGSEGARDAARAAAPAAMSATAPAASPAPTPDPEVVLGALTREQVEAVTAKWVGEESEARPDAAAVQALLQVPPGATVTVFLGTWCSDSRREVGRFWKAADAAMVDFPFAVRYLGIDRKKQEPAALLGPAGVTHLPTFIVERDGREVGRIVETSPNGIEHDLLALLTGRAHGFLSSSQPAPGAAARPAATPAPAAGAAATPAPPG